MPGLKTSSFLSPDPRDRLIVALDVPVLEQAKAIINELGKAINFYKIGYQLAFAGGLELAKALKDDGKSVFLDMKLLDIDNTVKKGVQNITRLGVDMLTIHAYPKAMQSAVEALNEAGSNNLCLLGVTVLTSMDEADLLEAGYGQTPAQLVERRALAAKNAGMGGIVCSAEEAENMRKILGPDMAIVTPGIRPKGSDQGDQKRVMTPAKAIAAGASHLVVGRPIIASNDRKASAEAILAEMADLSYR